MNFDAGLEEIQAEIFHNQLLCMIVSADLIFYEIHTELFFQPHLLFIMVEHYSCIFGGNPIALSCGKKQKHSMHLSSLVVFHITDVLSIDALNLLTSHHLPKT